MHDVIPEHAKKTDYYWRGTFHSYAVWDSYRHGHLSYIWSVLGNTGTEDTEEEARNAAVRWIKYRGAGTPRRNREINGAA